MADVTIPGATADVSAVPAPDHKIVFHGSPRNMIVGFTLLLAGIMAFVMGMTDVFFAEAMAWVFVIWGGLFLFGDLLDYYKVWIVGDKALTIRSPGRFWTPRKEWDWTNIHRMDMVVRRMDPKVEDIELQVYFTPAGDSALEREDRVYNEALAQLIVERAKLKPTHSNNPSTFADVPPAKAVYIWNRSGKSVSA